MDLFTSFLIARPRRAAVRACHAFAREARAIAGNAALTLDQRRDRLALLERGLVEHGLAGDGGRSAAALASVCAAHGVSLDHARHVLQAARLDAERPGCRSWSDLLLRCRYGAAPIGRFALDLHGEDRALWPAVDALCATQRILADLGRSADVVPTDWLRQAGAAPRGAIDRVLEGVGRLIESARPLARYARNKAIGREAAIAIAEAEALAGLLARRDPPVRLPAWRSMAAWVSGLVSGLISGMAGRG
jgi:phytoene/squalene synthetase